MPYWRLSGFYFFYFATLGVLVPYWGLYLKSLGFAPVAIGQLMALLMVSRIVAPVVWAWIADHRSQRMLVVRLAAFLTIVAFIGVFFDSGFWWLAGVMLLFSFFWNASLPLMEVTTINHLGVRLGSYGRVRLWGSIGFIASVIALGPVVDRFGTWWVLPTLLALMVGILLFSLLMPEPQTRERMVHPGPIWKAVIRPEVAAFLVACLLMQVSHGPYYTFYTIYLESFGYTKALIGMLWAFGVICEIVIFLLMQQVLVRLDLRQVLLASFLLAAVRWLLIGYFPQHLEVLVFAQALHAVTFGAFHATAIHMVHRFFTGRHQHRGQAIYGSFSFGIGGAVGSFYSGYTWGLGPTITFGLAAVAAATALVVTYLWIRPRT